jgi:Zn-dependent protease
VEIPKATIEACPQCGTQLAPSIKACPACSRLVHGERLTALARSAEEAATRNDFTTALAAWREALDLLPAESRQHGLIAAKITDLGPKVPFNAPPARVPAAGPSPVGAPTEQKGPVLKAAAGLGAAGLMLWKLKSLFLGLTKGTTLFSMLLSFGVYWTAWGWQFALGIVLSIYIHEMGHVIALHRYGFKVAAPMFIPGLGALIRLQQKIVNPREDAEIGLAGPIYGLGAAAAALGLWWATDLPIFSAIAGVGAWINLFNLLPIGSLDGGRGFHAMSRGQKLLAAATVAGAWIWASDGLLMLLMIVAALRVLGDSPQGASNWKATVTYCLLVIALTTIAALRPEMGV